MGVAKEEKAMSNTRGEDHDLIRKQADKIEKLEQSRDLYQGLTRDLIACLKNRNGEISELKAKMNKLEGNFSHFHVDNEINELCALCGLAVINAVHLSSR